jgi:hypothetical protein
MRATKDTNALSLPDEVEASRHLSIGDDGAEIPSLALRLPESAAPYLPPAVGWMMVAAYAISMFGFLLFFTGSHQVLFMLVVGLFYLTIYVAVPMIFLRIQPRTGRQVNWSRFLDQGMETWTGHLSGKQAAVQILAIPAALALAVFGIGIALQFSH